MVSISPPPADWSEAILLSAVQFMNAEVCFYESVNLPYDPITGAGGPTVRVLWRGKARVQHLRTPQDFATDYQAGATRPFRFQLDPRDSVPELYFGAQARVLNGGRDSSLESLVYTVNSAVNSSHMAVRTVELSSNMRPQEWDWTPESLEP